MRKRFFSTVQYFNDLADRLPPPQLSFKGEGKAAWKKWRAAFRAKLIALCGEWPRPAPLNPETVARVETDDGLLIEKVVFDTEPDFSIPAWLLIPRDASRAKSGRLPAIVCLHGHGGPYGKDPVAGIADPNDPQYAASVRNYNYDYGRRMARKGYVTLCPDSRAMGELGDGGNPYPGRDKCNVHFIRGLMLGFNLLTLNIWDMMRGIDYLQSRPEVDGDRIGAMGLSWGGTRTTFLSALDERVKAADIICYLSCFRDFAIRDGNFCGSQFLPGLYRWGDVADVAGLIAPRPLLVESGLRDTCFPIEPVTRAHKQLHKIYKAAGCEDKLTIDLFEGGHQFHGPSAAEFFDRWL